MARKREPATTAALIHAARSLVLDLYGAAEQLTRITIRTESGIRIWVDVPQRRPKAPSPEPEASTQNLPLGRFVPTPFQKGLLHALEGLALRTDALAAKVGSRRKLFTHPGGLRELQEQALIAHHKRLGYYRPDAPPPELLDAGGIQTG
jgi:hypothetical protein